MGAASSVKLVYSNAFEWFRKVRDIVLFIEPVLSYYILYVYMLIYY